MTLADDLVPAGASVGTTKLWRFCNPAAVNGVLAPKHTDHIVGYNLDGASSFLPQGLVKGVQVVDQFGTSRDVEIIRRDLMLLPTAFSLTAPPSGPITNPEIDDFACYRVRGVRRPASTPQVVIDDDFVTGLHLDVKQPMRLCLSAVRPPGFIDPGPPLHDDRLDPSDALMCYRTRPSIGFRSFRGPDGTVFINNALPDAEALERVNHLRELCVPAVVTLP